MSGMSSAEFNEASPENVTFSADALKVGQVAPRQTTISAAKVNGPNSD